MSLLRLLPQFLLLACLAPWALAQTTHNITDPLLDDFICDGNADESLGTPLANNATNLETLRSWCAGDTRCAELYAQDGAPNLATFTYLFQTTLTVPVGTVFLETPLYDLLCNKTTAEFLMAGWTLMLINQMLDAGVCDVNERFVLNAGGTGGTCVCQPGKVCESDNSTLVIAIIILVAVVLALAIQFGVVLWNRTRMAVGPRPVGMSRPTPESMAMGGAVPPSSPYSMPPPAVGPAGSNARYRASAAAAAAHHHHHPHHPQSGTTRQGGGADRM